VSAGGFFSKFALLTRHDRPRWLPWYKNFSFLLIILDSVYD